VYLGIEIGEMNMEVYVGNQGIWRGVMALEVQIGSTFRLPVPVRMKWSEQKREREPRVGNERQRSGRK
jgi:hypothetical protein